MTRRGLLLALAAAAATGCGYRLAGRGSFLPPRIASIGIPPFDSTVPRAEVAERITESVTREFVGRGGYRILPRAEGADAALHGTITGFVVTPVAFDEEGRATRSVLTITARVLLRDQGEGGSLLYDNPAFQFRSEVELDAEAEQFFDPESDAIEEIARDFARSLVASVVEGF